jgi:hypothetical protein
MKQIFALLTRPVSLAPLRRAALLTLVAATAAACVSPGPTREAMVCGQKVTFHPDDLKPCNGGASACAIKTGETSYHIHYSTMDESVLGHEQEHVCGMRHREPWVFVAGKICTVVTEGGSTSWKKGDVMCRVDAGPPIKITDTRIQAFTMNAR